MMVSNEDECYSEKLQELILAWKSNAIVVAVVITTTTTTTTTTTIIIIII
jgi:hypothetical protein